MCVHVYVHEERESERSRERESAQATTQTAVLQPQVTRGQSTHGDLQVTVSSKTSTLDKERAPTC